MTDILDRLRDRQRRDEYAHVFGSGVCLHPTLCRDAANEIERLRARVRELEAALKPFADDYSSWGTLFGTVYIRGEDDDPDGDVAAFRVEDLRRASELLAGQSRLVKEQSDE